ncbi:molybdopterin containing oxidoreductase [Echinicola strongylocentroti]|uniref:Molybdopterin containing oxidoreductase n=1 Tax=Echinicola strongylocentroti TaxID=1795355 RepID=A0A2Z4IFU4_9BACT|nr:sulfite oxidase [Echinicola strongylocentroti]AWW30001.1 molybdopterin containing oxidoreductase [Echinicola strongylocentroti]
MAKENKQAPSVNSRRKFLRNGTLATVAAVAGAKVVFASSMPEGYVPVVLQDDDPYKLFKKDKDLIVLNNKPWNMESQPHLLDDKVTPSDKIFIRNNGLIPDSLEEANWELVVDGEAVSSPKTYSLTDLKRDFQQYTYQLTLECGGNGRSEFYPPASGNQWKTGAVYCASWTGVRLKDVLEDVGIGDNAVYIGYHSADTHLSGNPDKEPISRGVPIAKALQEETLLAFEMNGEAIPIVHGYPLRLVAGGFPASVSGKWLTGISVRDKVHDGAKMAAPSYRVPCKPVSPGEEVPDEEMCIIESMPVKSLITYPKSGAKIDLGDSLEVRGHAWAGELEVSAMHVSIDFGQTWQTCEVEAPVNRLAWQHFKTTVKFPQDGYYEVWARATDSNGASQPMVVPGWNPKGYLNNACHRIAVKVG